MPAPRPPGASKSNPSAGTGYTNPFKKIKVTAQRIDQGVDYSGSGPLVAMAPGTIVNTSNSGWPGGAFIVIHVDSGIYQGKYIYYAEDISPSVHNGQHVTTGQVIGNLHGGMEIGFAAPPGSGESMARSMGQVQGGTGSGEHPTAFGKLMSDLIHSLGGPPGLTGGMSISGKVPADWPAGSVGGTGSDTALGTGNTLSLVTSALNPFTWLGDIVNTITGTKGTTIGDIGTAIAGITNDLAGFTHFVGALFHPQLWLRVGSFIAGILAFLGGLFLVRKALGFGGQSGAGISSGGMSKMLRRA